MFGLKRSRTLGSYGQHTRIGVLGSSLYAILRRPSSKEVAFVSTRFTPDSLDSVRRVSLVVAVFSVVSGIVYAGVVSVVSGIVTTVVTVIVGLILAVRDDFGAVSRGLEDVCPSVVLLDGPNGRDESVYCSFCENTTADPVR